MTAEVTPYTDRTKLVLFQQIRHSVSLVKANFYACESLGSEKMPEIFCEVTIGI